MRRDLVWLVAGVVLLVFSSPSDAVRRYGPLQVSGSLESQNTFETPDIDHWTFVQQRNTLRLRFDLDVIEDRKGMLGFDIPGMKHLTGFLIFRPVYDSIYDIHPGGRSLLYPTGRGGTLEDFTERIRERGSRSPARLPVVGARTPRAA